MYLEIPDAPATPVNSYGAIYCSNKCQLEAQYEEYIKRWKAGLETGVAGASGISRYIRRYFIDKHDEKCQQCGWQERNPVTGKVPLTIDHIDGDCLNNAEVNLRLLCPNCHSLTPSYGNLRQCGLLSAELFPLQGCALAIHTVGISRRVCQ